MLSFARFLNPQPALVKFLRYKRIKVDENILKSELEKHPDSTSLLGICDVLTGLGIENTAFHVSKDEMIELECPFMAYCYTEGGEMVTVTKIDQHYIYVSTKQWENHKIKISDLDYLFGGVVMTANAAAGLRQSNSFKAFVQVYRSTFLIIAVVVILALTVCFHSNYLSQLTWLTISLAILKSAGLVTSILLLVQAINKNNPLVQAICQTAKTDCAAILSSKAANLFEGLTWSEVGYFYFSFTWLIVIAGNNSSLYWQTLAVVNFLSLPYTVYSVYYQAFIARQWCVLCCTVQAILWLEFIPLIYYVIHNGFVVQPVNLRDGSLLVIFVLTPITLWLSIKPVMQKLQLLKPLKFQLNTFKHNTNLFHKLLIEQPRYTLPSEDWCIVLGSSHAKNVFTIATSPYCPPCADVHSQIDEMLNQNDEIQVRFVFTNGNKESDINTQVSKHFMSLYKMKDKAYIKDALEAWYSQSRKNYDIFAKKYPTQIDPADFEKLDKQKDWCMLAEITGTPTVLLNGYKLPGLYKVADLKYMLN